MYDFGRRRQATRKQRERGCSLYVPKEVLEAVGIDPFGPPPFYRTWPGRKRTVLVQLYLEP